MIGLRPAEGRRRRLAALTVLVSVTLACRVDPPRGVDSAVGRAFAPTDSAATASTRDPGARGDTPGSVEGTAGSSDAPLEGAILVAARSEEGGDGRAARLILEFRDDARTGYRVEYATAPTTSCGSGASVAVDGGAVLLIRLSPAAAHADSAGKMQPTVRDADRRLAGPVVRQLTLTCDFEGVVEWAVGLDRRRPFRVSVGHSPSRLVIDVS